MPAAIEICVQCIAKHKNVLQGLALIYAIWGSVEAPGLIMEVVNV